MLGKLKQNYIHYKCYALNSVAYIHNYTSDVGVDSDGGRNGYPLNDKHSHIIVVSSENLTQSINIAGQSHTI